MSTGHRSSGFIVDVAFSHSFAGYMRYFYLLNVSMIFALGGYLICRLYFATVESALLSQV